MTKQIKSLFPSYDEFKIRGWQIDVAFPKDFFRDLDLSTNPETNRQLLAERLDEIDPVGSSECETALSPQPQTEDDRSWLDFIKSFHLIKLVGQLIRNSPVALDATQKQDLVQSGFELSLRLVTLLGQVCSPASLQSQALNLLRERALKSTNRAKLEAQLSGLIYHFYVFFVFTVLRHASYYLAHPDLTLIYERVLRLNSSNPDDLSWKVLGCGLNFELRAPDSHLLKKVHEQLTPAGQDLLHVWTWIFLSFNRVTVPKRQAILESVGMKHRVQLLLPKGLDA